MQVFVIISNVGIKTNADVNVKNRLIKVVVIEDLFGILVTVVVNVINHGMLESILDYENCKSKNKLVDKLVEECCENID